MSTRARRWSARATLAHPRSSTICCPACRSLRSFSQTPAGISAVVDVASNGASGGGGIYRLSGT